MAETISNNTLVQVDGKAIMNRETVADSRVHVVRVLTIASDAAPSATTLYTVPPGRSFILTKVLAHTNNADSLVRSFYDTAGDATSGNPKTGVMFMGAAIQPLEVQFNPGIEFQNGITMSASDLVANKTWNIMLHGYLI